MNELAPTVGSWESSAASRQSPRHLQNEDAFANWPDAGLFVVADGLGGHAEGGLASRSIVELLEAVIDPTADLAVRVALVEEALVAVNDALKAKAARLPSGDIIASTVVAVLVQHDRAVALWVGDSRAYRLSDGRLTQVTEDHARSEDGDAARQVLTRAVGSERDIAIDRVVVQVKPGDTLLLCSDGLTKVLGDDEIAGLLAEPISGLADRFVARAVVNGGRDDITCVAARLA